MITIGLLIALAVSVTADVGVFQAPKLICYHSNAASRREAPMTFTPADIDPSLCTHLIYSFAKLNPTTFMIEPYESDDEDYYKVFNDLKMQNTGLKTLLAVGGWAQGSEGFSDMVQTAANRKIFIDHSIMYLRDYGFDGLDLNWEFPTRRGGQPSDKAGYASLAMELYNAYMAEADSTGFDRLLLSMALPGDESIIKDGYDVASLGKYLDFGNLMSYDLHGSWEWEKHHHTALFPVTDDPDEHQTVSWLVSHWLLSGFPSYKLNMGLALYGRSWKTGSGGNCAINTAGEGAADAGMYSAEPGLLAYYEICKKLMNGMPNFIDTVRKVDYACDANEWIGYDHAASLDEKITYLKSNGVGLGGGSVWALDFDDFLGTQCGLGPWPLMSVIKKGILEDGYVVPVPPENFCYNKPDGFYANPDDCHLFYQCAEGIAYPGDCGTLAFNPHCDCCDHVENVPGCT